MSAPLIMSKESLDELLLALRTTLNQVPPDQLGSTSATREWHLVDEWIAKAAEVHLGDVNSSELTQLDPFPISGPELRALRITVEKTRQRNARRRKPLASEKAETLHLREVKRSPKTGVMRLHQGVNRAHILSRVLAVFLGLALLFNGYAFFFLRAISPLTLIVANGVIIALALVASIILHRQVSQHKQWLQLGTPMHIPAMYVHG